METVIDWYSRYVLSWRLSNTLEGRLCLEALEEALIRGRPEIFNTDQGLQFTSREYTGRLEEAGIAVSRDGGRLVVVCLADLLGRDQRTVGLAMPGLTAPSLAGGWGVVLQADGVRRGSLDGLVELSLSRAPRSLTRDSNDVTRCCWIWTNSRIAAWSSGEALFQR